MNIEPLACLARENWRKAQPLTTGAWQRALHRRLAKQNTTNSPSSQRREYVSAVADMTAVAQNITSLFLRSGTISTGRSRDAARAIGITAGDFALAAHYRRIAISLLAGTLNSVAAFAIAGGLGRARKGFV
jgi:hypothetical protein